MPQVILATFRISSKPERADQHDRTSGFSSPGLSLDIHYLNMATFFCMPQCVPWSVYETMNVHEQTKKQDYMRLPWFIPTLVLIGIKEFTIK